MSGWIRSYRDTMEKKIWQRPHDFRLWQYLLYNARFEIESIYINGIEIKRGQYLRSLRKIQEDLIYIENNEIKKHDVSTIKRMLDRLVKDERITKLETGLATLITIVNYDLYQPLETGLATPAQHPRNNTKNENKYIYKYKHKGNFGFFKNIHIDDSGKDHLRALYFACPETQKIADEKTQETIEYYDNVLENLPEEEWPANHLAELRKLSFSEIRKIKQETAKINRVSDRIDQRYKEAKGKKPAFDKSKCNFD
jgi:hypothetical protein